MPHDINAALERLESNLQNLDSARKQVESTVEASSALQKEVGAYTSAVDTMCDKIKESASQFEIKFKESLQNFVKQNDKLTEQVQNLKSIRDEIVKTSTVIQEVKSLLSQISRDLIDSQKDQDIVLKRIGQDVTKLPNKLDTTTSSILENVNSSKQILQNDIKGVLQGVSVIEGKVDNILSALSSTSSLCQNIKADLKASTISLADAIENAKQNTKKAVNINRWLIIIGFIALALLQFLCSHYFLSIIQQ